MTYSNSTLSEAYCLAALHPPSSEHHWTQATEDTIADLASTVSKTSGFFSQLPIFAQAAEWMLKAAAIEGSIVWRRLRRVKGMIFSRENMIEDRYLEYIPFTWLACNYLRTIPLGSSTLCEMIVISMLNYQMDEYMESVVASESGEDLYAIESTIDRLCFKGNIGIHDANSRTSLKRKHYEIDGMEAMNGNEEPGHLSRLNDVERILSLFICNVLEHPRVEQSIPYLQQSPQRDLARFLKAHLTQAKDSTQFAEWSSNNAVNSFVTSNSSYYDWVRTTSADHTSCPYSFVFFTCIISQAGIDSFPDVRQKYIAQDMCRHLATMCRQYNDYGSIERDWLKKYLNSVDFPEFGSASRYEVAVDGRRNKSDNSSQGKSATAFRSASAKESLMWLAEYERECLNHAFQKLEKEISLELVEALKLFVDVPDLYDQIYVVRDIASRVK